MVSYRGLGRLRLDFGGGGGHYTAARWTPPPTPEGSEMGSPPPPPPKKISDPQFWQISVNTCPAPPPMAHRCPPPQPLQSKPKLQCASPRGTGFRWDYSEWSLLTLCTCASLRMCADVDVEVSPSRTACTGRQYHRTSGCCAPGAAVVQPHATPPCLGIGAQTHEMCIRHRRWARSLWIAPHQESHKPSEAHGVISCCAPTPVRCGEVPDTDRNAKRRRMCVPIHSVILRRPLTAVGVGRRRLKITGQRLCRGDGAFK